MIICPIGTRTVESETEVDIERETVTIDLDEYVHTYIILHTYR